MKKLEEYQKETVVQAAYENIDENYYLPEPPAGKDQEALVISELFDLLEKMEAELPPNKETNFNEVYDEAEYNLVNDLVNEYESAHYDMVHT